jgi:P4 family phage/plasmid primase-like protien
MVGSENTSSLTLQDLSKQFRAQFLQNKLVNVSTETDTRDPLTTAVFKAVVDGSPLTTERKYGEPFQYRPYAKWIVAMNEAPVIPDKSYGFGRRVLVLNFNRRFEPEEIKERMADYLIEEIDGVFNWAIAGLAVLLKQGFVIGDKIREDTDKLMEVLNPLLIFVNECCEVHDDISESTRRMWDAYNAWCSDGRNRPMGRNKFYEQLLATFTLVKKKRVEKDDKQEMKFINIRLTEAGNDYADKGARRTDKMFEGSSKYQ